eukprot:TRINITY_DN2225_c0_g1_i1.p1 TRINITY_DN2225_c0_g1~~TRINITY_DN2225_c0_g1_i1.p1  ORF type:complete len:402 (+),score=136.08 TRINITY_DN2225_c0_g1_i1:81-1286(+)
MATKKGKEEPKEHKAARFGRVKNNLRMGIVGLPNVGKSSLFNLLTEQAVAAENYPFCTIDPNESRCAVPDERFDWLCNLWQPVSRYPAYLHITDIAGLVKGASEGQGLGNAFLSHIQAVDGIFHVVRAFENHEVLHVEDSIDPVRDLETIQRELCLKDLAILDQAVSQEQKDVRKTQGMKISGLFTSTVAKIRENLEANKPVRDVEWSTAEVELINNKFRLITTKPVIYLVNLTQADFLRKKNKFLPAIHKWIQEHGGGAMIPFSVEFETGIWNLRQDKEGLEKFLKEHNSKSALPKMITTGYHELDLIHFFTVGEPEVRCWTVIGGTLAPQAAGVIHTDFEHGFIKAEVTAYEDFKSLTTTASMAEVKSAGKCRQEGKQYVMHDGDIVHFHFNVTTKSKK